MLPEIRKAAILLDALSPDERSGMMVVWPVGPTGTAHTTVDLGEVDLIGLTFELLVKEGASTCSVRVPLEAFKFLHDDFSGRNGRKRLHISGQLGPAGPEKRWQWSPTY